MRALIGFVLLVAAAAGVMAYLHFNDPTRKAEKRTAALIEAASGGDAELALRNLDAAMNGEDWGRISDTTKGEVGAAIVRRSASFVKEPFGAKELDAAGRVVSQFQALPGPAHEGAARTEMLAVLARWETQADQDRETKIALLRFAMLVTDGAHRAEIGQRIAAERFQMAKAIAADWPVDALGFLGEEPRAPEGVALAGEILARLADQPALLVDAGRDVDAWLSSVKADDPVRLKVEKQRALGREAQTEDADLPPANAAKLLAERPWDQWLIVKQANADLDAGKPDAAEAKLRAIGAPGMTIREATFLLGRIAMSEGKLDVADQILSGLLRARLQRFLAASAAFQAASTTIQDRLMSKLKSGMLPPDLIAKLDKASESEQRALVQGWMMDQMESDATFKQRREELMSYSEVVPASILAGMAKLRRAQSLTGVDRDTMLGAAERTFLAVRMAAEGQPEYHLGLGEIYARLGKTAESDAEFKGLLDKHDPELSLRVATTYRNIGSVKRATEVATQVYEAADTSKELKEHAAVLIALMADTDELRETWYRRGDMSNVMVKSSLLDIEARRLRREGKRQQCDQKFAEAAKLSLQQASAQNQAAYNNAALSHQQRFSCTGDLAVLKEAERTLEQAYRVASDAPIIVVNLASLLRSDAAIRALAKRIDARVIAGDDAWSVIDAFADGPERAALLADITADPGWRRSNELYAQHEVLAPSSTQSYREMRHAAERLHDEALMSATVDKLRAAKRLDTSELESQLRRYRAGEIDKELQQENAGQIQRYTELLATKLDPHTRAAVLLLQSRALMGRALMTRSFADLPTARDARVEAAKLWPALPSGLASAYAAIDIAGAAADGARWQKLRRERSAAAVLADLVRDNDPLAAKIRAAPEWSSVATGMRGAAGRPDLDDLRLARVLGDPAIIAWAQPAAADKVLRLGIEADKLLMPSEQKRFDADLAELGKP